MPEASPVFDAEFEHVLARRPPVAKDAVDVLAACCRRSSKTRPIALFEK